MVRRDGLMHGIFWPYLFQYLSDKVTCSNCNDIYREIWVFLKLLQLVHSVWQQILPHVHDICLQQRTHTILFLHWLILNVYRAWSWVHHGCLTQMIITACLSRTIATFSLTAMHLTRQVSSRQRDWQRHNEAWQSAPAWFVWRQTPEHFSDLDKLFAPGGADAQKAAQWDQLEIERKALEQRPCQAIEMNIIRKERVSPDLEHPSLHLRNIGLCPLTSSCTSEIHQACFISHLIP